MSSKGILTGGRALTKLIQQDSALGTLIQKIINGVNSVATNTATSAVGKIPPPPSPNSINVTTPGGFMQVTVNHSSEIQKGIQYITHVGTDPDFVNPPIVVDHGSSRSPAPFALPIVDHTGTAINYYVRTLAQYQGSDASTPTIFGVGAPTPITLNGATNTLQPGTGSGTGSTSGQQSLVGLGKVQRTSSGTNPSGGVQTGGGIPAPPTPSGTAGGDLSGTYPNPQVASTHLTAPLPVNQGGSGTTTPSLVAGTNVTITGSWPDQTVNSTASGGITQLTGAVTAGPGTGSQATTLAANAVGTTNIANAAVTLAKIANAAANSKLLGSGASGSGAAYAELTLGTNLSMSGTTLNAAGGTLPAYIPASTAVPLVASLTAVNTSTSSAIDTAAGIFMHQPFGSTQFLYALLQTAPGVPYTYTVAFQPAMVPINFMTAGICLSDGTKIVSGGLSYNSGFTWALTKWNSATSFSANYTNPTSPLAVFGPILWLRYQDNGTNRIFAYSLDGVNFIQVHSVGRTDFLTPTSLGVFINAQNGSVDAYATVSSWLVTTP